MYPLPTEAIPGQVFFPTKGIAVIACITQDCPVLEKCDKEVLVKVDYIGVDRVKVEGKREVGIEDWRNGYQLKSSSSLVFGHSKGH